VERSADMRTVVAMLTARHPRFPGATIERLVTRTFDDFHQAKIQTFVPILVYRQVHASLRYADAPGADATAATTSTSADPTGPRPTPRLADVE
jgi:hypothetical protein